VRAARLSAIAISTGALVLGVVACDAPADAPREGVSTRELTGDLSGDFDLDSAVVGAQQSLRVTVGEVLSRSAFTTTPADAGGTPLLVVGADKDLQPGQVVQVVGTLRVFSYDEFASQYALGDADAFAGRDGDKVLVARLVDTDIPDDDQ
jgi:hypothetical protein